jgi:hypothetical protein
MIEEVPQNLFKNLVEHDALAKNREDMAKFVDLIPMIHEVLPNIFAEEFLCEWYPPSHLFSYLIFRLLRN